MASTVRKNDCWLVALCAGLSLGLFIALSGCSGSTPAPAPGGTVVLKGAGATAPYLVYSKWIDAYKKEATGVDLQYRATGSGEGLKQLEAGSVDFAASDIPVADDQLAKFKTKPLHFPTLIGAIVPVYNVLGAGELKFPADVLAGIFSGKIKSWGAPALAKANPGVTLPAGPIVVVHRADASGSTYALTDYLSKASPAWKAEIGPGATVKWPVGRSATGNEAVAELVRKTPNSIGYVELNYAIEQKLNYGAVQNSSGKFIKADLESVGTAVDKAEDMKSDFRISLVNAAAAGAYPISTLTWLVVPSQFSDPAKLREMKAFLRWIYGPGQKMAMTTDYGVLQPPLLNYVNDQIGDIH